MTKALLSVGCLTALLIAASPARALECKTSADCGKGFKCELVTAEPTPAARPTCAPDSDCAKADVAPPPAVDAGTSQSGYCTEDACAIDADCGATMVCHAETYSECTGGTTQACAAGEKCLVAPPPPSSCTTKTVSTCKYRWQLPCNADADCGGGFTCAPSVSVGCSGSGGTAVAGGGTSSSSGASPTAPSSDSCTTTSSFPGSCTPKATTCAVDADCPTAWACVAELPSRAVSSSPTPPPSADGGSAIAVGEPTSSGAAAPPADHKVCASPLGTTGAAVDVSGTPETTNGGGSGGATGTKGPTGTDPRAPAAAGSNSGTPNAGCAIGGGASGSALTLSALALLGLVIARRRRQ